MPAGAPHPLDPLSAQEIRAAAATVRREHATTDGWRFAVIDLHEPAKHELTADPAPPRVAEVVCWNREDGRAFKGTVSLAEDRVASWAQLAPGEHPSMTDADFSEANEVLRRHPAVVEALAKRGLTEMELVLIDVWAFGAAVAPAQYAHRRIGWADVWHRSTADGNPYANPVAGLHPIVDLNTMELLELQDDWDGGPAPRVMGEYAPQLVPGLELRNDVTPLEISQPAGASFMLDGNELRWQKWSMRLGFNYREGLVLHLVGYEDAGRVRPVAHRMSFAEMVVPYRDPTSDHYRRTAFDIGEWGLGHMTTSLALGCDCLGEISYLDATLFNAVGEPVEIKNAVCIHEEDDGVLWKHVDHLVGADTRRMRRLVVSFHATVANYEYLVYWRFYQDGSIQCEVRATGIMITTPFSGSPPPYGTVVDTDTYAPFHQHFIVARLDLDVDGAGHNTVICTESEALPVSDQNPHGLALTQRATPLRFESDGVQDYDWHRQRAWKVINQASENRLGGPVSYKLEPGAAIPSLLPTDSPVLRRARAIEHDLWVTPYSPDERWPCGEFPNQSLDDRGLPVWTAQDRPIQDADIVLWYVFGINHVPRPEDWPVMPVDVVSFWLKPFGFFDRNPALDVPAQPGHDCAPGDQRGPASGADRA
jgi:primary-amine oxidase